MPTIYIQSTNNQTYDQTQTLLLPMPQLTLRARQYHRRRFPPLLPLPTAPAHQRTLRTRMFLLPTRRTHRRKSLPGHQQAPNQPPDYPPNHPQNQFPKKEVAQPRNPLRTASTRPPNTLFFSNYLFLHPITKKVVVFLATSKKSTTFAPSFRRHRTTARGGCHTAALTASSSVPLIAVRRW